MSMKLHQFVSISRWNESSEVIISASLQGYWQYLSHVPTDTAKEFDFDGNIKKTTYPNAYSYSIHMKHVHSSKS